MSYCGLDAPEVHAIFNLLGGGREEDEASVNGLPFTMAEF